MSLLLPLRVENGRLVQTENLHEAIAAFIELLLTTTCHGTAPDPDFGFIFNNLRFEIFNENEGVIYNSHHGDYEDGSLYGKKVSGTSRSVNTFATELRRAIEAYEKRLDRVAVTMAYLKNEKRIHIHIEGIIRETNEDFRYDTSLNVWN